MRVLAFHYLLRSAILGGFTFLIVRLVRDGKLDYYIAPRTELYVKLAAIGLFLVAVCQAYIALQTRYSGSGGCGCSHRPSSSPWKNALVYGLFVLPLGLGYFGPDTLLGSGISSLKGMNLSSGATIRTAEAPAAESASPETNADPAEMAPPADTRTDKPPEAGSGALEALFPYDKYTVPHAKLGKKLYREDKITIGEAGFMEILTTLDLYRDAFLGKTVEIGGFVYREDGMEPNQFVVSRLAMQCCSADTEPYGVIASSPDAAKLADDAWVSVTGTIGLTSYAGNTVMELAVSRIEPIDEPETPYVYPNDDYFELLLNGEMP